jgi:O-antigen/teichoic acid export membrane protein
MSGNGLTKQKAYETERFLAIEIYISIVILLVANVCWSPLIDSLTKGKYGTSNSMIFLTISLCLPLQFAINLFWTVCFSAKKYRQIARITFVTAIINLALNIILIPRYGGMGAAGAYLVANLLQAVAYFNLTRRLEYNISLTALLVLPALGACMYLLSVWITPIPALQVIIAIILFTAVSFILKQVQKKDIEILASYLKK